VALQATQTTPSIMFVMIVEIVVNHEIDCLQIRPHIENEMFINALCCNNLRSMTSSKFTFAGHESEKETSVEFLVHRS